MTLADQQFRYSSSHGLTNNNFRSLQINRLPSQNPQTLRKVFQPARQSP